MSSSYQRHRTPSSEFNRHHSPRRQSLYNKRGPSPRKDSSSWRRRSLSPPISTRRCSLSRIPQSSRRESSTSPPCFNGRNSVYKSRRSLSPRRNNCSGGRNEAGHNRSRNRSVGVDRYISAKPFSTVIISADTLEYSHTQASDRRIAVFGLKPITKPEEIYEWCYAFGRIVKMIFVCEEQYSNRHVAFIEYESRKSAEEAVNALHNHIFGAQRIGAIFCEQIFSRYSRILRVKVPDEALFSRSFIESIFNIEYLTAAFGTTLNAHYNPSLTAGFITFGTEKAAVKALEGLRLQGFYTSRRCDPDFPSNKKISAKNNTCDRS